MKLISCCRLSGCLRVQLVSILSDPYTLFGQGVRDGQSPNSYPRDAFTEITDTHTHTHTHTQTHTHTHTHTGADLDRSVVLYEDGGKGEVTMYNVVLVQITKQENRYNVHTLQTYSPFIY